MLDAFYLTSLICFAALVMDHWLGETPRWHPLVGFGNLASRMENVLNLASISQLSQRILGLLAWISLTLPLPIIYYYFHQPSFLFYVFDAAILYLAIGLHSLRQHALAISQPLEAGNLEQARYAVSMMVSRDTAMLSSTDISRATVESVLENGHDAVIASMFWYAIGGAPLVLLHRLSNTLDAMWGYKNQRFRYFGWCAAKMDDLIGWPSAKITAIGYALARSINIKKISTILFNASQQAKAYKSLNGGLVMATGAFMLGIQLGGSASYHQQTVNSANLGQGATVQSKHIAESLRLVTIASLVVILLFFVISLVIHLLTGDFVWL